jgi:methylmalonyl-CoA/ethylmalonyl-CoA epimerase
MHSVLLKKVDHIGIVVRDLEEAVAAYSKGLGVEVVRKAEVTAIQLKIAILKVGELEIELLQYQNPDHPLVKSLNVQQTGLHHVGYAVEGFDGVLEALRANGCVVLEGFPRKGIFGKIAFLTPPYLSQERIEIIERAAAST